MGDPDSVFSSWLPTGPTSAVRSLVSISLSENSIIIHTKTLEVRREEQVYGLVLPDACLDARGLSSMTTSGPDSSSLTNTKPRRQYWRLLTQSVLTVRGDLDQVPTSRFWPGPAKYLLLQAAEGTVDGTALFLSE